MGCCGFREVTLFELANAAFPPRHLVGAHILTPNSLCAAHCWVGILRVQAATGLCTRNCLQFFLHFCVLVRFGSKYHNSSDWNFKFSVQELPLCYCRIRSLYKSFLSSHMCLPRLTSNDKNNDDDVGRCASERRLLHWLQTWSYTNVLNHFL